MLTPQEELELSVRVSRGAKLLDEKRPGWWKEIRGPLDIEDPDACVLGQVYGDYLYGLTKLGLTTQGPEHGFSVPFTETFSRWTWREGYVTRQWYKEIAERNAKAQ